MKAALRWYLPLVIVAATLNLRPALLTLGLVLPAVQHSLALSPFGAGALTALPIFALGAASALAVPLGRRLGWSGALVFALALIGAGTLLRSAGSEVALYGGALILGIGIGLGNVYVPTLVKARLAARIGVAMGVYTMMLTIGALIAILLTPLFVARFADWRPTLAVWGLPALGAALLALPLLADNLRPGERTAGTGLWRNPLAWAVACYMGLQSAMFYSIGLWLGVLIAARGVSLHDVAADFSVFYFTQFILALGMPILLTKARRQEIIAVASAALVGAIVVAILYAPVSAIFAFCGLLGLASGALFGVALTFQVLRARTHDSAARLASMAQCVGYLIASVGPLVLGLVNRGNDARLASAIWLATMAVATMIAGAVAGQPRFVDAPSSGDP
ncbi:MAG TPA: MFS transporter [Candidatus Lustribacter sp.]|nr:MFS transporter [Candidatus Lustribacter sp.]